MNKSKLISIAVLCALALGACVDDKESASVTALRDAKTTYLKAQSDYQNAQAEVAKINAEVAKAKAQAEAEIEKLRAEAEVIRLKAEAAVSEAEAEKCKAEAAEIQQRAADAAKRFEVQLAELQAQAKMNAAKYEADYQTYINELAKSKRQAELDKRQDIVTLIGQYSSTLGSIRQAESEINTQTVAIAGFQQQKLNALAGTALAQAKNDVITKEAVIAGDKVALQHYQLINKADADKQKALVEELRAGLAAKAGKVQAAKDNSDAIGDEKNDLADEIAALDKILNGYTVAGHTFRGKLDTLRSAWKVLSNAEWLTHQRDIRFSDDLTSISDIQYYAWEVDKLLTDMNSMLKDEQTNLTTTDTLAAATKSLEKLFTAVKNAQDADIKAKADLELKEKALIAANESGDAAKIAKAQAARDKAYEAVYGVIVNGIFVDGTQDELSNIVNAYERKRNQNINLDNQINDLKNGIELQTEKIKEVEAAKAVCFGTLLQECLDLETQITELRDEVSVLWGKIFEADAQYMILVSDYSADKTIVDSWDSGVDFNTSIESAINTKEGAIATAEKELEQLKALIADPDQTKLAEKYCSMLNASIAQAEELLAIAEDNLEQYKALADSQKALLDAWQAEMAE